MFRFFFFSPLFYPLFSFLHSAARCWRHLPSLPFIAAFPKYWLFSLSSLIIHRKWKIFGRTDCKMAITKRQPQNCLQLTCNSGENRTFVLILTGKTLALAFLAPPCTWMLWGQAFFPTIHHSHSKWHTYNNRKFLKHYRFRQNGKTISLQIHKGGVNSCSQKLKVNQVDSRDTTGQRFFSWRSFP